MRGARGSASTTDRLGVVGNQDSKDAAEKHPGGLARLDRARCRFLEGRIDEAVARAHGREDPRAKSALLALRQREPAHPARIELQLVSWLAIEHGDRRRRLPKLQLEHRKAVEGAVASESW
jgi:hypothetical protein